MQLSRRLLVLIAILATLAGLVFFDDKARGASSAGIAEATQPKRSNSESISNTAPTNNRTLKEATEILALDDRETEGIPSAFAFSQHDWTPPPPPPSAATTSATTASTTIAVYLYWQAT